MPLVVGRVLLAVALHPVDLDDDAGAVRSQEQEVHPLPVQRPRLLAAAPRVGVVMEVDLGDQRGQVEAAFLGVAGAVGDHEQLLGGEAPVPQLYLTLMQKAHAILRDASREGLRLHYPNGDVEHVTPQVRRDVHAAITTSLERDWPPYIQGLIDRGALQTQ
ncbi:hypothetical protein ACWY4P_00145 [Streptomyces sp. LZ34]